MTPERFVEWLHGYLEIENPKIIGEVQTQKIKDHINLMFDKKTQDRTDSERVEKYVEEAPSIKNENTIEVTNITPSLLRNNPCLVCGKTLGLGYVCSCMTPPLIC